MFNFLFKENINNIIIGSAIGQIKAFTLKWATGQSIEADSPVAKLALTLHYGKTVGIHYVTLLLFILKLLVLIVCDLNQPVFSIELFYDNFLENLTKTCFAFSYA